MKATAPFPPERELDQNKHQKIGQSGPFPLKRGLDQIPEDMDKLWIFVGSEGGFSGKDIELFRNYNILPVSLGDQVLRVETACVTLLGVLKYHLGQFQ